MTLEQAELFCKIYHHKFVVMKYLGEIIRDLVSRAEVHDMSKFDEDEFPLYLEAQKDFKDKPYGTPEHDQMREKYQNVLQRHYNKNRHHPEHHPNGVEGMTLVDLLELLVDWKAASLKDNGGDINNSIKVCAEKYNLTPQLVKILENTARNYKL